MNEIDIYLSNVRPEQREQLERLREIAKRIAPEAEECISYGVPTLKFHGMLCSFAAFKNHCSFFPGRAPIVACADELKDFKTSAGTVQFTLDRPLPDALIEKMLRLCVERNAAKR
ncbi:MAG: DUF1801 domain-containing protein [Acidobacteria bacterium]|nr:DUF1801 domain-containing protein [Acidobacteriota bacterium]MBK8149840.1 DUF1801 domain-containing protein [Acidobacteriota bacterium]MBK8809215.1 DUF1801 domain-containing protein [Acidobacteriota bacterium]